MILDTRAIFPCENATLVLLEAFGHLKSDVQRLVAQGCQKITLWIRVIIGCVFPTHYINIWFWYRLNTSIITISSNSWCTTYVRIVCFCIDSTYSKEICSSQSSSSTAITNLSATVSYVLFWKVENFAGSDSIDWLNIVDDRKWIASTALTLIIHFSYDSFIAPIYFRWSCRKWLDDSRRGVWARKTRELISGIKILFIANFRIALIKTGHPGNITSIGVVFHCICF